MISNHIRVVVGIIKRDKKILVAERPAGKPYSGYWEFPGGKINDTETSHAALKRELLEELGIQVTLAHYWFEHIHAYPDKTVLLEMWQVESFTGEPVAHEQQKLKWVTSTEIISLCLLDGNWSVVRRIQEFIGK